MLFSITKWPIIFLPNKQTCCYSHNNFRSQRLSLINKSVHYCPRFVCLKSRPLPVPILMSTAWEFSKNVEFTPSIGQTQRFPTAFGNFTSIFPSTVFGKRDFIINQVVGFRRDLIWCLNCNRFAPGRIKIVSACLFRINFVINEEKYRQL